MSGRYTVIPPDDVKATDILVCVPCFLNPRADEDLPSHKAKCLECERDVWVADCTEEYVEQTVQIVCLICAATAGLLDRRTKHVTPNAAKCIGGLA